MGGKGIKAGLVAMAVSALCASVPVRAQDGDMEHHMMHRHMMHRMMRHEMHHRMMHRMMRHERHREMRHMMHHHMHDAM